MGGARKSSLTRAKVCIKYEMPRLKSPEVGHLYCKCLICRKVFRITKSRLKQRLAAFCTRKCYWLGRKLFIKWVFEGRSEALLKQWIAEEQEKESIKHYEYPLQTRAAGCVERRSFG